MNHTCQTHPDHDTAYQIWRDTYDHKGYICPDYLTQEQFEFAVREHENSLMRAIANCPRCSHMYASGRF